MNYSGELKKYSELVLRPTDFFQKIKDEEIKILQPAAVLLAYIALNSLLLAFKPVDFPKEFAAISVDRGYLFYLGNYLTWGILSVALFSLFSAFWIRQTEKGNFIIKASSGILILAFVFILIKLPSSPILKSLAALIPLSAAAAIFFKIKRDFDFAMKSISTAYLIPLLFIPLSFLAVHFKSESAFTAIEAVSAVWLLAIYVKIGKFISKSHIGKLLISYILGMISALIFFYALTEAGIMSSESFKILLLM